MKSIKSTSLEEFYQEASLFKGKDVSELLPPDIHKEIGHFNVLILLIPWRNTNENQ